MRPSSRTFWDPAGPTSPRTTSVESFSENTMSRTEATSVSWPTRFATARACLIVKNGSHLILLRGTGVRRDRRRHRRGQALPRDAVRGHGWASGLESSLLWTRIEFGRRCSYPIAGAGGWRSRTRSRCATSGSIAVSAPTRVPLELMLRRRRPTARKVGAGLAIVDQLSTL